MMEETLGALVEFIKQASPVVWAAAVRQAYVQGFQNLFLFLTAFVAGIVMWKALAHCYWKNNENKNSYTDWGIWAIFAGFGLAIAVACAAICLSGAVARLANPDYYAIQLLIGLIPGG